MTYAFFTTEWFPLNIIMGILIIGLIIWLIVSNSGKKKGNGGNGGNGGSSPSPGNGGSSPGPTLMTGTNLCFQDNRNKKYWSYEGPPRWQDDCSSTEEAIMKLYSITDPGACDDVSDVTSVQLKDGGIYRMCYMPDTECLYIHPNLDSLWSGRSCDTTTNNEHAKWLLHKDGNGGVIHNGDKIWLQCQDGDAQCLGNGPHSTNVSNDFCWTGDGNDKLSGQLTITNASS